MGLQPLQSLTKNSSYVHQKSQMDWSLGLIVCLNTAAVSACYLVYKAKSENYECFSALSNGYI